MTTTMEAIYENGKLVLTEPLPLRENSRVLVTVQSDDDQDPAQAQWLALSERSLMKAWDNADDDVFNELLSK